MFVPFWIVAVVAVAFVLTLAWLVALLRGRNPLPFPDGGSRIFATPSVEAKEAVVELLCRHGLRERFRFDTGGVRRSIFRDGTIVNSSDPAVLEKLHHPAASIGLVADDPAAAATRAAEFLRERGFTGEVVLDAEPELPIAFVVTDAFSGTVLNFRRHVTRLPRQTPVRD